MICKIQLGLWKWGDIKRDKGDSAAELSTAKISEAEIIEAKMIAAKINEAKMIAAEISEAFACKRL